MDELTISIINAFDVIYNYLYPQLIELDDIGEYFTSDDLTVDTIHGTKPLFDNNFIYNNIVDFLDELMETSKDYTCALRASNTKSKIYEFTEILNVVIKDRKFSQMLERNNAQINFTTFEFESNNFYFEAIKNSEEWDNIGSCYSPYYNVTAFCGECGKIYFLIVHDKHELYVYDHNKDVIWPQHDEAEPDNIWLTNRVDGACEKLNLSKRNLLYAFESIFKEMQ